MKFFEFLTKQRLMINMFAIFVTVAGFLSFFLSSKETFPPVKIPWIVIVTAYPNASPEEVEKLITVPYEDAVKGIKNVKEVNSSTSEGFSMINIQLEPNTKNTDKILNDIERAIDKAQNIPEEAEDPDVFEISTENFPVLQVGVSGGRDYEELRGTAKLIEDKIKKISHIGDVQKWGYLDRTIWVNTTVADLEAYSITLFDLMNAIKEKNMSSSSGNIKLGQYENAIRVVSEIKTGEEVSRVILRSNESGSNIRVGSAATVVDGFKDDDMVMRLNAKRAIMMTAYKRPSGDTIKSVDEIKKLISQMQKDGMIPKSVDVAYSYDMAQNLKDRLKVVYESGTIGALMVLGILLLLMRPSVAIFTAIGLPVSFGIALLCMKFFGVGANMLSLFGYIMVLGMLVDNNIVIGENVFRYIELGEKPFNAVVKGTIEVIIPVLASVLTTVASFAPLLMITGTMGEWLRPVPIVIIVALVASLIESFLILPSHLNDFVKPNEKYKLQEKQSHWFNDLRNGYANLLKKVLYKRTWFIIGIIVLLFVSIPLGFMRGVVYSEGEVNQIVINIKTPNTNSLLQTEAVTKLIEDKIMTLDKKDVESVQTYIGYQDSMTGPPTVATNLSQINVMLIMRNNRKTKDQKLIIAKIREIVGKPEGVSTITISELQSGGMPPSRDIDIAVTGDTYDEVKKIADEIMPEIQKVKGVTELSTDLEQGKKEIKFVINEANAARAGVSISSINGILRSAVSGMKAVSIKRGGEDIDIMVRLDKNSVKTIDDLLQIRVPNMMGQRVLLRQLVKAEEGYGYTILKHRDGKRSVSILGSVDLKKNISRVNGDIGKILKKYEVKYPGTKFLTGGEYGDMMKGFGELGLLFLVALVLIFIVIAALFNSLVQPVVIMLAIPFGFIGVMLTFFIHGQPVSFAGFLGFIGLAGVVVNNSILMTDFFNNLMKRGRDAEHAIVEAASVRLRPIMLTTLTTAIGVLPMGYSIFGAQDPMLKPVALVFAWGLLFGTVITLFLIPCFHVVLYNFRKKPEDRLFYKEPALATVPVLAEVKALKAVKKK